MFLIKKDKATFKTPDETEVNNLPDKEFKAIIVKMLTELKKVIEEHRNRSKEIEIKHTIQLKDFFSIMGRGPEWTLFLKKHADG